jgi:sialate O-acetylesterase
MRFVIFLFTVLIADLSDLSYVFSQTNQPKIELVAKSPDGEKGYEKGVSAAYAGILNDKLILAGGCNFPDVPAAEGGKKRFYKGVYVADIKLDNVPEWKKIGDLPQNSAYGVAVNYNNKIIIAGGQNESSALRSVFTISYGNETGFLIDSLPSLPVTIDNMAGAVLDGILYLAGGKVNGIPSNEVFSLNLTDYSKGWKRLTVFPGNPRVQPVMSAVNGCLYIWGGFSPAIGENKPSVSNNGWCFNPQTGLWKKLPAPREKFCPSSSFTGAAAIALNENEILCVGGVNAGIFMDALKREQKYKGAEAARRAKIYLSQPAEWYRFNQTAFVFNVNTGKWRVAAKNPLLARAGAAIVKHGDTIFYINGEIKPGIRSAGISKFSL